MIFFSKIKVPKRGLTNEKLISEQHNTFFTFHILQTTSKKNVFVWSIGSRILNLRHRNSIHGWVCYYIYVCVKQTFALTPSLKPDEGSGIKDEDLQTHDTSCYSTSKLLELSVEFRAQTVLLYFTTLNTR